MSASSTPTVAPSACRARARFTAVVDLPTPPLPEATAMMLRTPGSGVRSFCTLWAWTREATDTVARATPGRASRAPLTWFERAWCQPAAG